MRVCLYVLCGHLLGKDWPLGSRLWYLLWVSHFPIGILGQVWYLIVSIPDLCTLTYFKHYPKINFRHLFRLVVIWWPFATVKRIVHTYLVCTFRKLKRYMYWVKRLAEFRSTIGPPAKRHSNVDLRTDRGLLICREHPMKLHTRSAQRWIDTITIQIAPVDAGFRLTRALLLLSGDPDKKTKQIKQVLDFINVSLISVQMTNNFSSVP